VGLAILGLLLGVPSQASADFTTINITVDPTYKEPPLLGPDVSGYSSKALDETGNESILEYLYGYDAHPEYLERIDDDLDQWWKETDGTVSARAKFTSTRGQFGFFDNANRVLYSDTGTVYHSEDGSYGEIDPATDPSGSPDFNSATFSFYWFFDGAESNHPAGGADEMVTFRVTDAGKASGILAEYILGFEDGTDDDFQDLVVEVSGAQPIPAPTSLMGLVSMGVMALVIQFSRRRRK
jgi:hypothetical protein